jgi:hypothetical protein
VQGEFERRWPEAAKAMPWLLKPTWIVVKGAGPCALVGRVHDGQSGAQRNYLHATYRSMLVTFINGHLDVLMIRGSR